MTINIVNIFYNESHYDHQYRQYLIRVILKPKIRLQVA